MSRSIPVRRQARNPSRAVPAESRPMPIDPSPAYGQEAVPIGVASAMHADDILVPSYRENAALIWRGVGIDEVLSCYAGSERGSDGAGPTHDFPTSITVGGHALHAAGAAFAVQYRGEARAMACVFGDAATSKSVEKLFGAESEPPSVMFDTLYAEPPAELVRQREAALRAIAAAREAKRRS